VRAFDRALAAKGVKTDVKIYPGAGHAFASSTDRNVFKKDAAVDADARTLAFLHAKLRMRQ
jgi:dienelactone hydrolase